MIFFLFSFFVYGLAIMTREALGSRVLWDIVFLYKQSKIYRSVITDCSTESSAGKRVKGITRKKEKKTEKKKKKNDKRNVKIHCKI